MLKPIKYIYEKVKVIFPLVRKAVCFRWQSCLSFCSKWLARAEAQRQGIKDLHVNRTLAIMAFLAAVFTYNLWPFCPKGWFYKGLALHFILVYVVSLRMAIWPLPRDVFTCKVLAIGLVESISNLVDETYGDPTMIELNEYAAFLLCVSIAIIGPKMYKFLISITAYIILFENGKRTGRNTKKN